MYQIIWKYIIIFFFCYTFVYWEHKKAERKATGSSDDKSQRLDDAWWLTRCACRRVRLLLSRVDVRCNRTGSQMGGESRTTQSCWTADFFFFSPSEQHLVNGTFYGIPHQRNRLIWAASARCGLFCILLNWHNSSESEHFILSQYLFCLIDTMMSTIHCQTQQRTLTTFFASLF